MKEGIGGHHIDLGSRLDNGKVGHDKNGDYGKADADGEIIRAEGFGATGKTVSTSTGSV